jgi:hypothetical protein
MLCSTLLFVLSACIVGPGMMEFRSRPYAVIHEEDGLVRFSDRDDNVLIEVRRVRTPSPLEKLAIHYPSLFPGADPVRSGDSEEYLEINGHKAYRVVFACQYLRKRKRVERDGPESHPEVPSGWSVVTMEDPVTGKPTEVLQGPVIPSQRILYVVQGDTHVYAIFMRADGDRIEEAKKHLDEFLRNDMTYK